MLRESGSNSVLKDQLIKDITYHPQRPNRVRPSRDPSHRLPLQTRKLTVPLRLLEKALHLFLSLHLFRSLGTRALEMSEDAVVGGGVGIGFLEGMPDKFPKLSRPVSSVSARHQCIPCEGIIQHHSASSDCVVAKPCQDLPWLSSLAHPPGDVPFFS